ncbi:MAG: hypothetical protein K2P53_05310 [Rickettsiales bacterium]|jgi:chromosome segregation ATPase|nr:hypothetical protein [Rickettsiales bacterium]
MSVVSQDSENTNTRESKDLDLSAKEHGKGLNQIYDEMDRCADKINRANVELDEIKGKVKEKNDALKGIGELVVSKNQDIKEKQVTLGKLQKLYAITRNGPDIIKNERGEVTKVEMLQKINEKINEAGKEFGILEREVGDLMIKRSGLVNECKNLTEKVKVVEAEINQLQSQYQKLEKQIEPIKEKDNKQFESELGKITESLKNSNVLKLDGINKRIENTENITTGIKGKVKDILDHGQKSTGNTGYVNQEKHKRSMQIGTGGRH